MIKYSIVVCCYGKMLVNVAAYVIRSWVYVCGAEFLFTPHDTNKHLTRLSSSNQKI